MTSTNPFMTLVDAATSIIDKGATKKAEKESIDIRVPPKAHARSSGPVPAVKNQQNITPPPPASDSTDDDKVVIISPPTPRANNRSPKKDRKTLSEDEVTLANNDKNRRQASFARILMDLLMDMRFNDVITFLPDGDAFAIMQHKKFAEEIMPQYFQIRTFSPFVRKLHRWGFERIMDKKTHDVDVFRHPLFIRGNYVLCEKIKCVGRLVKTPYEEELLSEAGLNTLSMGMPTHQELEIRSFFERRQQGARVSTAQSLLSEAAKQNAILQRAQSGLHHGAQFRHQAAQQEAQLRQQAAHLQREVRLRRTAESEQIRRQKAAESAALNQILVASLQKRCEDEMLRNEVQRLAQEEILRQQVNSELQNALQQARLRDQLLAAQRAERAPRAANNATNLQLLLLRQALENNNKSAGGGGALTGFQNFF